MLIDSLKSLQAILGVTLSNIALLQEALTHSSYVNENPRVTSNERLEFLGDAVLGMVLAEKLFQEFPHLPEGDLTQMRSRLICRTTLASIARANDLGSYLLLGQGEAASGGRGKPANLAGALEAIFAAVYLDCGWENARECIVRVFGDELAQICLEHPGNDYKSQLQETLQSRLKATPSYRVTAATGPSHNRQFTAEVVLGDKVLACGMGRSKKLAETEAARMALRALSEAK